MLRLLDEGGKWFELANIGQTNRGHRELVEILDKPHGMFVVTGPTGSGKSITLYAALQHLNRDDRNIVTVEDPVEFRMAGINQVQRDNEFGMGFANALKFIMRQDPDVIMVGQAGSRGVIQSLKSFRSHPTSLGRLKPAYRIRN